MRNLDTLGMERVYLMKKLGKSERDVLAELSAQDYYPEQLSYLYNSLVKPGKVLPLMLMHIVIYLLYAYSFIYGLLYVNLLVEGALYNVLAVCLMPMLFVSTIFFVYEKPIAGYRLILPQFALFIAGVYMFQGSQDSWIAITNSMIGIAGCIFVVGCYWYAVKERIDPSLARLESVEF